MEIASIGHLDTVFEKGSAVPRMRRLALDAQQPAASIERGAVRAALLIYRLTQSGTR